MKTVQQCIRVGLAVMAAVAVTAHAQTPAASAARAAATRAGMSAATPADAAWPQAAVADATKLGFTKAGLDALDARLKQSVADGDTAGMTIILLRHGQVADFKSFGQATPNKAMALDSLFRIYSMSKPITGVAMMQLYEQGKWQLDDPITKYAPELANLKELTWDKDGKVVMGADGKPVLTAPKKPATMRQLMSHTAGFGYGLSGDDPANKAFRDERVLGSQNLDEMMQKIVGIPLLYEPGTKWSYSVAVDIQGYLVQKLSGQKFGEYLKAHVTGPIGMSDTAFFVSPDRKARFTEVYHWDRQQNTLVMNVPRTDRGGFEDPTRLESGGGGLVASTHDYARFCQMMLNKGEIGGKRLLKPETVKVMAQNHIGPLTVAVDGTRPQPGAESVRFGLDFAVYVDPKNAGLPFGNGTFYWGGAAGTWFWIDPVNDLAFIGMIQMQGGNRPDGLNFRADSAKMVYAALAPSGGKPSDR
ncbi:MAG TPA: serine hydrolase domain-containing protein [Vicinamibacterales bacterium]|nr:serine hydrolase domain-containing protein [Vicinamibacterales bacterium]